MSPVSLAWIAAAAVLASILSELLRRWRVHPVVLEIALGIVIGPAVLGWAEVTTLVDGLSQIGLAFLIFLAGYEIDFARLRGTPLDRAVASWGVSLLVGLAIGGVLTYDGYEISDLMIGLVLTTSTLGALVPILRDAGALSRPFGRYTLAAGAVGEFAPIIAVTLLFAGDRPARQALWLGAFVVIALVIAFVATRPQPPRFDEIISRHLTTASQLPVRVALLLLAVMLTLAYEFSLDILLGSFTAGMLFRPMLHPDQREALEPRLTAIGFGFVIPIFFIVSGMKFDLEAVTDDIGAMIRIPIYLVLFLVVRGGPALLLYRNILSAAGRRALALMQATALPLVVVITEIGRETGRMSSKDAAALVGAAMLSMLLFPTLGLAQLRGAEPEEPAEPDHR
jgi:Kef-type K+ transport system membrane component KefB